MTGAKWGRRAAATLAVGGALAGMAAVSAGLVGPTTRLGDPVTVLLVAVAVGYWVALVYWARRR